MYDYGPEVSSIHQTIFLYLYCENSKNVVVHFLGTFPLVFVYYAHVICSTLNHMGEQLHHGSTHILAISRKIKDDIISIYQL